MAKKRKKKKDLYVCANCKRTLEKGWSDEEAEQEVQEVFGNIPPDERSLVCDDCYNELMAWLEKQRQETKP